MVNELRTFLRLSFQLCIDDSLACKRWEEEEDRWRLRGIFPPQSHVSCVESRESFVRRVDVA